ncbi:MAG: tyrosine-protein phosphatase [Phycisphaerae bacterium]|nr:tyrosine-protein phosphatase [Phycisphaerae bacterium]
MGRLKSLSRLPLAAKIAIAAGLLAAAAFFGLRFYEDRIFVQRFHAVVPGVLYRSAQPTNETSWRILRRYGITTIVMLRVPDESKLWMIEEREDTREHHIQLVVVPMLTSKPQADHVAEALKAIRSAPRGCLVHCEHGRSRTGLVVAAYRVVVQGWSAKTAIQEMANYGCEADDHKNPVFVSMLEGMQKNRDAWLARTSPLAPTTTPQ